MDASPSVSLRRGALNTFKEFCYELRIHTFMGCTGESLVLLLL